MSSIKIGALLNNDPIPQIQWLEVFTSFQIPSFQIVGLPSQEIGESRERIRAAIHSCGFEFPRRRVVLNLSPSSVRKQGTGLDLAMALSILAQSNTFSETRSWMAWGELGLDGTVKSAGQITRALHAAWRNQIDVLILAKEDSYKTQEAMKLLLGDPKFQSPQIFFSDTLLAAWNYFKSPQEKTTYLKIENFEESREIPEKFSNYLPPTPFLERILGIAAVGHHHLLLLGPNGIGKSHALDWLIALRPPSSPQIKIEQALLAELLQKKTPPTNYSRISPHSRPASLIGSIQNGSIYPGAFTQAHGGILIADEFPEWPRDTIETLREPLEKGKIVLTRNQRSFELPALFQLIASGNLCPCGGTHSIHSDSIHFKPCRCNANQRSRYRSLLSGPILDRIDLVIQAHRVLFQSTSTSQNHFQRLQEKVIQTHEWTTRTWGFPPGLISGDDLEKILTHHTHWNSRDPSSETTSLRNQHKIIRIALTLAAWDRCAEPNSHHFKEAAYYRSRSG